MQKIEEEKEKEKEVGERIGKESENSPSARKGSTEMREDEEDLEEKGTANGESEKAISNSEAVCDDLDELNKSLVRLAKCSIGKKRAEVKIQDIKHQQSVDKDIKQSHRDPAQEDHEKEKEDKEKEDNTEAEEDQKEIIKETKSCKEKEDSHERSQESQRKLSVESPAGVDGKDDVFVYLCPFPDCDFSTDFQVNIFNRKM